MKKIGVTLIILLLQSCENNLFQQVVRTAQLPTPSELRIVNYSSPGLIRLEWDQDPGTDTYEIEVMDPASGTPTWSNLTSTDQNFLNIFQSPQPLLPIRWRYRMRKIRGTIAFPYSNHVIGVLYNVSNDSSENNNTQGTSTPLSWSQSTAVVLYGISDNTVLPLISDYDVDWFKVTVPAGRTLSFKVDSPPETGSVKYRVGTAAAMGMESNLNNGPVTFVNSSMTDTEFFLVMYPTASFYSTPPTDVHFFTAFSLIFNYLN